MWTDLFKPAASRSFKPCVDRVDRVDGLSAPVSVQVPAETLTRPGVVAESVDRVDWRKAQPIGTPLLVSLPLLPDAVPGVVSPCVAMATKSASNGSTQSTKSTQGKQCRLLTIAEKNALLAQFDLNVLRAEMEAPVAGRYTANDLRRTINVAWRLITVERLDFDTAMAKAAEWVAAQPMHQDELFFADVLTFSKGA
jgi:hypothetical protein